MLTFIHIDEDFVWSFNHCAGHNVRSESGTSLGTFVLANVVRAFPIPSAVLPRSRGIDARPEPQVALGSIGELLDSLVGSAKMRQ